MNFEDYRSYLDERMPTVDFKKFLRPERKFPSLEALKDQLNKDSRKGLEYFENLHGQNLQIHL